MTTDTQINEFIARWKPSGGSEQANYQLFVIELTDMLGLDRPFPATDDDANDHYRFERPVTFTHTHKPSTGFIDVYRSGHFVLETKQGVDQKKNRQGDLTKGIPDRKQKRTGHGVRGTAGWDGTMLKARNQADNYARAVSKEDGWPPFLLIVDIGHVIDFMLISRGRGRATTSFQMATATESFSTTCVTKKPATFCVPSGPILSASTRHSQRPKSRGTLPFIWPN